MISVDRLPHRAIIKKPADFNAGLIPDFVVSETDVPCWLVPETDRISGTGLGRMITGRYQILFQKGTEISPGWKAVVSERIVGKYSTETKDIGTFQMETVVITDTHTEAIAVKET